MIDINSQVEAEELAIEVAQYIAAKNPTDRTAIMAMIRALSMILVFQPEDIEDSVIESLRGHTSEFRAFAARSGAKRVSIQ